MNKNFIMGGCLSESKNVILPLKKEKYIIEMEDVKIEENGK